MTATYCLITAAGTNPGNVADAITATVGGSWYGDVAAIDCDGCGRVHIRIESDAAADLEAMLDTDDDVLSYTAR